MKPYVHSSIFPETLNTTCRWSKRSTKKNILPISKVVTFEATPKLWGMEYWRRWCKERTSWTRSKYFPVWFGVMACCSFYIYFCAFSSSCCCIIEEISSSLMIICYFSSIFYTPSSSIIYSAKASWASLEISKLSSGGIDMAIVPIIPEEIWSTICLERIFAIYFWPSVLNIFPPRAATMWWGLRHYRWQIETLCW